MLRKSIQLTLGIVISLVGYLALWPVPIEPVAWKAPVAPPLEGRFAKNEELQKIQTLLIPKGKGPEDVAIDSQGSLYAGLDDGRIIKFDRFSSENFRIGNNTFHSYSSGE